MKTKQAKKTVKSSFNKESKVEINYLIQPTEHPEFSKLLDQLEIMIENKINKDAPKVKSKVMYKCQYVLEELIKHLERAV